MHHVACFDLQGSLSAATAHISNFWYKRKHFTYNCIVCDFQMPALTAVHWYLWPNGVRENKRIYWNWIMLIAVLDEMAGSSNNNLEINFYSNNCSGQGGNKFIIASFLHVVTNVQYIMLHINMSFLVTNIMRATVLILWCRQILKDFKIRYSLVPSQHAAITRTARENEETLKVHDWTVTGFWISRKLLN